MMNNATFLALVAMFFAGLTSIAAKYGVKNISPDLGLVIRTMVVFGIVVINFMTWNSPKELQLLTKNNVFPLLLSGIFTSASWIFYYRAIKIGNVSQVALIDKGSIIITLILSFTLLGEPVTAKVLFGAGFILVGIMILMMK
jgi:bacterial/archaeal transporter family protein